MFLLVVEIIFEGGLESGSDIHNPKKLLRQANGVSTTIKKPYRTSLKHGTELVKRILKKEKTRSTAEIERIRKEVSRLGARTHQNQ